MNFTFQINTLLPLAALLISLGLAIIALRYSSRRLLAIFIALMLAISWWSFASILENAGSVLSTKIFWLKMTYFGIVSIPVFWIIFTGYYSGGRKWLTRRNIALLTILPVVTVIMVWTNDIHHLMWNDIWLNTSLTPAVDAVTHGTWFWIHSTYSYALLAIGVFYLIRAYQQSDGIYRKQAGLLILAGLIPWIGNFLFIAGVGPFTLVDPTPLAFAITGTAFLFGLSRLQLLDLTPIAQGEVFKSMADGVIVIDDSQRISDINPSALSIFNILKSSAVGQPYNIVMPILARLLDTKDAGLAEIELQIGGLENPRYFTVTVSPIQAGSRINGHVIIMKDDTNRRKAEVEYRERTRLETELNERKKTEGQIKHLASFPESNPNPVTELSYEGKILYSNPAAWRSFPDLESFGLGHPYLGGWKAIADELKNGPIKHTEREVSVGNNYFDQTIQFIDHRDVYRIYGRNITERKRAEEALRQSEHQYRLLIDNANESIVVAQDGLLKFVNPMTLDLFGRDSEQELIDRPYLEFIHPDDRHIVVENHRRRSKNEAVQPRYDFRVVTRDGIVKWVEMKVALIEWQGKPATLNFLSDVTERKKAMTVLKESEQRYRTLFDSAVEGILIADVETKKFIDANPAICTSLGYSQEELTRMNVSDIHPKISLEHIFAEFDAQARGEKILASDIPCLKKDGTIFYADINNTRATIDGRECNIGFFTDVTGRKQAKEALDSQNVLLASLIDSPADILIFSLDREYRYTAFNESHRKEMRKIWKADIKVGANLLELITNLEARGLAKQSIDRTFSGESFTEEQQQPDHNIYYEFNWSPIREKNGEIIGCTAFIRDITEFKKAEEEKHKLEEKAQITSRLAAVGEMASGIAHEINNPLTGVIGFSELLLTENLPPEIKGQLQIIADGGQRVKNIVRGMLTFAHQTRLVKTSVNINDLIDNTLGIRSYVLRTANIEVIRDFDPDLPCVTADPGQLQQVFLNLIVNAEFAMKKAHDKGNLIITTEAKDGHIRISFRDDGPGMSPEIINKIFNPFFTTKAPGEGTGLGLSLSRSIILEHAGTIGVESEPGKGTNFIITLPVTTKEEAISETKADIIASPEKVRAARILVVDDEDAIRSLVSKILTTSGHTVDTIGDPDVVLLKLENISYDVVIVDIRMPGMSGMELYDKITEKHPELARKVIFITGDTSDLNVGDYLNQHDLPYISKPFDRATLLQKVNGLL
jgi:PAS domain S-box-containing protein